MIFNFHLKLIERMLQETRKTLAILVILSIIIIIAYHSYVPSVYIYLWIFAQSIFVLLRYLNAKTIQKYIADNNVKKIQYHMLVFTYLIVFSTFIWNTALIGGALFAPNGFEFFSFILTIGILAGGSITLAPVFGAYVLYYLFLLLPELLYISSFDDEVHKAILLISIAYIPFMFLLSRSVYINLLTMVEDNIELNKSKALLKISKDKAEESTKLKSEFLANMSHEIRTPINGVIGMTKLALKTNMSSSQRHYIQTIESSSSSLLNIINDILDFSKIEAGKLKINNVDFNLYELCDRLKDSVEFKIKEKNLNFNIDISSDIPNLVHGDSLRISQILINLTNNAIKFTDSGYINIIIKKKHTQYIFEVKDSGIGISKEDQSKLFKSFSQADATTTRKYGGTGLGLSISKELVKLMSGEIWLESILGQGSSFKFFVPMTKVIQQPQPNVAKKDNIQDIQVLHDSHILLVEDNIVNQEIILGLLEDSGINIDIANNGKEAIQKFETKEYALILMDLQMPIMDGYGATKYIRNFNKSIPIIALTANAMSEDIVKTKKAGMNEHLNKPVDVEKLCKTLLKYIPITKNKNKNKQLHKDKINLPTFQSIDVHVGLKYMNGDKKLYLKVLQNFFNKYSNIEFKEFNENELKLELHSLKGLGANIGAMQLLNTIKNIKGINDIENLSHLKNQITIIIDELNNLPKNYYSSDIEKKLYITKTQRDTLFVKLEKVAKTNRPINCINIIKEIEKYQLNNKDTQLLLSIKKLINNYKFKEIVKILSK